MTYILYFFLALVTPLVLSLALEDLNPIRYIPIQSKLKPGVEPLSKIADAISKLKNNDQDVRIDLDYYDGFDRYHPNQEMKKEDHSDLDISRSDSFYPFRPRTVYVSNPEVLKAYQKNLKKEKLRGSSSESDNLESLSIKDILEFLFQVEARLQERGARAVQKRPFSFSHLDNVLKTLRRQNEDSFDYDEDHSVTNLHKSDSQRPTKNVKVRIYSSDEQARNVDERENDSRGNEQLKISEKNLWKKREKNVAKERVEDIRSTEHLRKYEKNWKKTENSIERDIPRPKKNLSNNNVNHFRSKPRVKNRLPSFMGTPIPMIGKKGIYEEE